MKFTIANIDSLIANLAKIERLFAYKYLVAKEDVALIVKNKAIYVLINGKLQESFRPEDLLYYGIDENALIVTAIKPTYKPLKQQ